MILKFPNELVLIQKYLSQKRLTLSKQFKDGRINASFNEDEVIKEIQNSFSISIPKSRAWYDFAIESSQGFYPVNIKVTDTTHADNLNCKLGIYYTLTGLLPDFANEIRWQTYFERLRANLGTDTTKDYYFLIVNKNDQSDIFINSLKGLSSLQSNGNNLPFQCHWGNNRIFNNRTFEQSLSFILSTFAESIKLRSQIYLDFKQYFSDYV